MDYHSTLVDRNSMAMLGNVEERPGPETGSPVNPLSGIS